LLQFGDMASVWISLATSVIAVTVTGIRAGRLGWATFKDSRRLSGALGAQLATLSRATARLERSAAAIEGRTARLEASLARLAASRRRLAVLTGAIDEVQSTLGRVTQFFPRK
jgi:ABC-type transporter Mla subunit MlaD